MKNSLKLIGIIAIALVIGFAMAACGDIDSGEPNKTPVATDYNIGKLNQKAGIVTAVTITPKADKSPGAVTILYDGAATIPQEVGTYPVTFNVAAVPASGGLGGWNAAKGLEAGTLTVSAANQTPVADDYDIGNLNQIEGEVTAVTITPKEDKSPGEITIYYDEETEIPQEIGSYLVTFDVEEAAGWNAEYGLVAGMLTVKVPNQTPVADDYDIGKLNQTVGNVTAVTITPKEDKSPGAITIYYDDSTELPTEIGEYVVTFDVAEVPATGGLGGWNAADGLSAGTLTISPNVVLYIITGSGTEFTAKKDGVTVGTANQPHADVINAIRADAGGENVAIQFGNGTTALDLGSTIASSYANFANTADETWGLITLSGKITSACTNPCTVYIQDGVSAVTNADINNTSTGNALGNGLRKQGAGTVTILSGTISSNYANGVYIGGTGGYINISGGTVSSNNSAAVYNTSGGNITVSGTASITSPAANTGINNRGTINNNGSSSASGTLTITGGTVSNTSPNGNAVYNANNGTINISGGTVQAASATEGYAVYNANTASGSEDMVTIGLSAVIIGRLYQVIDPAKQVPTADDYNIGNLDQTDDSITPVTITPKEGKSTGAVTIYYNAATTLPTAAGTYPVTFAVEEVPATGGLGGWNGMDGILRLSAGTLTINKIPAAADYNISNLNQASNNITPVLITPKAGKSSGAVTIYYDGSTTLPTAAGTYPVTFDVAAVPASDGLVGWIAKTGFQAGTLTISSIDPAKQTPVAADFDIGNLTQANDNITAVTITPKTGKSAGAITVYYDGLTDLPDARTAGTYAVTFDVAAADGWNVAIGLSAGTLTINPAVYIITGSGTSFTAQKNGVTNVSTNATIANVMTAIRTDANGRDTAIQFGNGTTTLDVGTAAISLNNTGGTWGKITFLGKITSASTSTIIAIPANISAVINADIANTATNTAGTAVSKSGVGTVDIIGGAISANAGRAYTCTNGTTNISGGTISSATNRAISNLGQMTISGTAVITSAANGTGTGSNATDRSGTIFNYSSSTSGNNLTITGGTISNTSATGWVVVNVGVANTITISGGTVQSESGGYAVYNATVGATVIINSPPAVIIGPLYQCAITP